ncbi:MAG: response regulator [Polyangiaceae bacterium]|nr:response regulator [Polyangiaceae bacterium]
MSMQRIVSGVRRVPTLLLVDDRRTNLLCLKLLLEPEGYRLLTASSGAAALGTLRTDHVDLVILDVMMPGLDGIEVAERMRASPTTAGAPILFVTAAPDEVGRFSQRDREDVATLPKPVDGDNLRKLVTRLLLLRDEREERKAR